MTWTSFCQNSRASLKSSTSLETVSCIPKVEALNAFSMHSQDFFDRTLLRSSLLFKVAYSYSTKDNNNSDLIGGDYRGENAPHEHTKVFATVIFY